MSTASSALGLSLLLLAAACGSGGSTPPNTGAAGLAGGGGGQGGNAGGVGASGSGGGSGLGGAGGQGGGTCGNLPACVANLFDAGCFPSTTAGPCTKSMSAGATNSTFTYCFANGTKLVIVSDNSTGHQLQTYSNASKTCFTETVVPNGPYTYFDPSGTAVGSGVTTISDGGVPTVTITCTGGQPVVVSDQGSCPPPFNISLCTDSATCQ
jgi:hypothetical protein